MWFSGVNTNGLPNCLESATSPTPDGQFTVTGPSPYCDPNQFPIYDSQGNIVGGNEGDFDPSIYRDPFFGGLWLYYSQEFSETTGGGNASIHVVALSPDGTATPAGTDYTVATQADVAAALPTSSVPPGNNPQIENPQMDGDYGNQISPNDGQPVAYGLYLSYGTYSQTGAYHTVELGCEFVIGPCFDRNPTLQDYSLESGEGQNLVNPGGMSLAFGGPIGEYALFAAQLSGDPPAPTGARGMFYENPSSVQGDYGATTSAPYQTQDNQVP